MWLAISFAFGERNSQPISYLHQFQFIGMISNVSQGEKLNFIYQVSFEWKIDSQNNFNIGELNYKEKVKFYSLINTLKSDHDYHYSFLISNPHQPSDA